MCRNWYANVGLHTAYYSALPMCTCLCAAFYELYYIASCLCVQFRKLYVQQVLSNIAVHIVSLLYTCTLLLGAAGYPGTDELPYFAKVLQCRIALYNLMNPHIEMPQITAGEGDQITNIGYKEIKDGEGHSSGHFVLLEDACEHSAACIDLTGNTRYKRHIQQYFPSTARSKSLYDWEANNKDKPTKQQTTFMSGRLDYRIESKPAP